MPVYYTTIKPNYTFQFATPLGFAHCNELIFMQFTRKSDLCVICTYGYTPYISFISEGTPVLANTSMFPHLRLTQMADDKHHLQGGK